MLKGIFLKVRMCVLKSPPRLVLANKTMGSYSGCSMTVTKPDFKMYPLSAIIKPVRRIFRTRLRRLQYRVLNNL